MAIALKYDLNHSLVKEFGDSKAKLLNDFVTEVTNEIEVKTNKSKNELKYEVRDDLQNELATKQELFQVKQELKQDVLQVKTELLGEIQLVRAELKTDNVKLNQKFNFMLILLIIALTLMNPVVAKIISNLFKLGL